MKTINATQSNSRIITIVTLLTITLALMLSYYFSSQTANTPLAQDAPIAKPGTNSETKSTSELINAALAKTVSKEQVSTKNHPKVTPTKLDTPFSPTLEGTEIDGQLKVGEDGKLLVNLEVKDFFDYFLSTVGEVSPELALEELIKVAKESLPPENFEEATRLLDSYLAYKEEAVALLAQPMLPRDQQTRDYQIQVMEESLQQLRDLRRQHMSEEQVEAFFGLEEAYQEYTLASVKIQFDNTLSEEEKAGMIQYHRSLLPKIIRQTEDQLASDGERTATIHKALSSGDEDTLISELNGHHYSDDQKEEILAYTRSQSEFDQRYQQYLAEKKARTTEIDNPDELLEIITRLQSEYFHTEQEVTQAKVRDLSS